MTPPGLLAIASSITLLGGVYFAFSTFVMRALAALEPSSGMAAMQAINRKILNPGFALLFGGTALVCALIVVVAALRLGSMSGVLSLVGSLIYLLGSFGWTLLYHVPRNDALARFGPADPTGHAYWRRYLREWVAGNHVRTVATVAAAALFLVASLY